MSLGLARLKGLASGLGAEIESQNELLDRLQDKAEKNEWKVDRQNKEMARILKKK
jgi:synaptosomal-associated protein 29